MNQLPIHAPVGQQQPIQENYGSNDPLSSVAGSAGATSAGAEDRTSPQYQPSFASAPFQQNSRQLPDLSFLALKLATMGGFCGGQPLPTDPQREPEPQQEHFYDTLTREQQLCLHMLYNPLD
jgi:hypothetical protein